MRVCSEFAVSERREEDCWRFFFLRELVEGLEFVERFLRSESDGKGGRKSAGVAEDPEPVSGYSQKRAASEGARGGSHSDRV